MSDTDDESLLLESFKTIDLEIINTSVHYLGFATGLTRAIVSRNTMGVLTIHASFITLWRIRSGIRLDV